jgi:hypothetical protein
MGTIAGSTHISEGRLSPFLVSNLPMTICRHLGFMTVFSAAFMSQELVVSFTALRLLSVSFLCATCWLDWGLCPSLSRGKTVRAACREGEVSILFDPVVTTASAILPLSKSILAPVLPIKSVPINPAALVGSEHT